MKELVVSEGLKKLQNHLKANNTEMAAIALMTLCAPCEIAMHDYNFKENLYDDCERMLGEYRRMKGEKN